MTVKLRPGTHYVQVERGVLVAQRDTSFVLSGPPALYRLIDDNVGLLLDGTDASALAAAVGDPAAEPVFEHVLTTLLGRDVLFDVAAGSPPPTPADRQRFARTVSYCEAHCIDPYGAFAVVRAARVAVIGGGPAAEPLLRTLESMGVGYAGTEADGATLVVLIEDFAAGPAGWDAAGSTAAVLPVVTASDVAVVGPIAAGAAATSAVSWTAALADRAAQWVAAEPEEAAPWPLGGVLAGSLAARAVLKRLLGLDQPDSGATVVHGRLLSTTTIPRSASPAAAAPDGLPVAGHPAAGTVAGQTATGSAPGSDQHAGELLASAAALTTRFSGPIRRGRDEDLPQLPMCVASAQVLDAPVGTPPVLGWGPDRGAAGLDAVLRASRLRVAIGADGGGTAGAGLSRQWAELDGRLRLLGARMAERSAGRPVTWSELTASRPRALWSLLEEFYGRTIDVSAQQPAAGPWTLVTVRGADDHPCRHWGFSLEAAVFAALGESVARLQSAPEQAAALRMESIGTHVLAWTSASRLASGMAACELGATEPEVARLDPQVAGLGSSGRRAPRRVAGQLAAGGSSDRCAAGTCGADMAALTVPLIGSSEPAGDEATEHQGLFLDPACPPDWPWAAWAELLAPTALLAMAGFDADRAEAAMRAVRGTGRGLLTVRVGQHETVIGPEWWPAGATGCAGCADIFQRASSATPVGDLAVIGPWHAGLVEAVLRAGVGAGEVVTVSATGQLRRHALGRYADCPHCGTTTSGSGRAVTLRPRPATADDSTRQRSSATELAAAARALSGGHRFGTLHRHVQLARAAFPVAEMGLSTAGRASRGPVGFGRGITVRAADELAMLEAAERLGGYPSDGRLLRGVNRRSLGTVALELDAFGDYTEQQLQSPLCRVRRRTDETEMDWAWAQPLTGGEPRLLPADLAFPWHRYPDPDEPAGPGVIARPGHRGSDIRTRPSRSRDRYFLDSSSGTALGGSVEEALLHALFECIERDAFQLAWHRQQPLTGIAPASITDPDCRLLMNLIDREGFDLHLLVATADVPLPVVWALAVNRLGTAPACFSTAGAHPESGPRGAFGPLGAGFPGRFRSALGSGRGASAGRRPMVGQRARRSLAPLYRSGVAAAGVALRGAEPGSAR